MSESDAVSEGASYQAGGATAGATGTRRLFESLSESGAEVGPGVYRYSMQDVEHRSTHLSSSVMASIEDVSRAFRAALQNEPPSSR
jgi:hypothetical protein